jgi:threonine dehydratase
MLRRSHHRDRRFTAAYLALTTRPGQGRATTERPNAARPPRVRPARPQGRDRSIGHATPYECRRRDPGRRTSGLSRRTTAHRTGGCQRRFVKRPRSGHLTADPVAEPDSAHRTDLLQRSAVAVSIPPTGRTDDQDVAVGAEHASTRRYASSVTASPTRAAHATGLVGLDAIRAAADTLRGIAVRTPLVAFGPAEDRMFLKAESLQPTGAFKIRGAYVAIASLSDSERQRGVITYSSGNHAQGVARAARLLGAPAVVVMPSDAPEIKRSRVAADGAEIVTVGPASEERRTVAEGLAAERGLAIIPPYDDDRIIAGQGTVGLEIADDLPDLALVLVPIGGGGLASGVSVAVKALRPRARVIGVEPELAADARDSLREDRIVSWPAEAVGRTIADGTRTQSLGVRTFAHLRALLDGIVMVSESEIAAAVRIAAEESRLVVEPSGALTVAALRSRSADLEDRPAGSVVAVVSGGNVEPATYRDLLGSAVP